MKPSFFITLAALILVAWASLFITVFNQSAKTNELLKNDVHKFQVLKKNQDTLICIIKGFTTPVQSQTFIDNCVRSNQ